MINKQTGIFSEDELYYNVSNAMYIPNEERDLKINNYVYQKSYSGDEVGVWGKDNHIIISFRDKINTFNDYKTILQLKLQLIINTNRFKDNLKQVKEVITRYRNYNITFCGIGLGARLAIEMLFVYPQYNSIIFHINYFSPHRYKGLNIRCYLNFISDLPITTIDCYKECIYLISS